MSVFEVDPCLVVFQLCRPRRRRLELISMAYLTGRHDRGTKTGLVQLLCDRSDGSAELFRKPKRGKVILVSFMVEPCIWRYPLIKNYYKNGYPRSSFLIFKGFGDPKISEKNFFEELRVKFVTSANKILWAFLE